MKKSKKFSLQKISMKKRKVNNPTKLTAFQKHKCLPNRIIQANYPKIIKIPIKLMVILKQIIKLNNSNNKMEVNLPLNNNKHNSQILNKVKQTQL